MYDIKALTRKMIILTGIKFLADYSFLALCRFRYDLVS